MTPQAPSQKSAAPNRTTTTQTPATLNPTGKGTGGSKRRMVMMIAAGVTVAAIGATIFIEGRSNSGPSTDIATASEVAAGKFRFAVGDPGPGVAAPPIVLTSTTGATFDLAKERGKGVLLYFQEGIGCQPCWDQMRDYATAAAGFKAAGVDELVTITVNPVNLLARKMRQGGVGGIVLADPDLAVSKRYHANQYGMMGDSTDGHSFIFVDSAGIVRWRADYGGSPDFTMYVPPANLLADLRVGLHLPATP